MSAQEVHLHPQSDPTKVSLAPDSSITEVFEKVCSNLKIQGRGYSNITFGVVPKLCADIVLGQNFLNQYEDVVLKLVGVHEHLVVEANSYSGVSASSVDAPRLFHSLDAHCKLIATEPRKFNQEDKHFIRKEVSKLLTDKVIEPSYSPWRAQVLIARDGQHKPSMVIDYWQTIPYLTRTHWPFPKVN